MITCFILDDEQHAVDSLSDYVQQTPFLRLVGTSTNSLEALEPLGQGNFDLLFLDIHMSGISGLDVLKISKKPVILTTAYSNYALDGFEYGVIDYLLKPITYPRFLKAAQKVWDHFKASNGSPAQEKDFIFIKGEHKGKQTRINFAELDYVESARNYVIFHCTSGKHMTAMSLKEVESMLPRANFIRIHNSYIVPLSRIIAIDGSLVVLKGGKDATLHKLPVGTTYRSELMAMINWTNHRSGQ